MGPTQSDLLFGLGHSVMFTRGNVIDLDSRPLRAAWSSVACMIPLLHVKAHGPALSGTSIPIGLSLSSWKFR